MAETRTSGITTDAAGNKVVDKWVDGQRIRHRLGPVSQEAAEAWLADHVQRIRLAKSRGTRPRVAFREAAVRYLKDFNEIASIDTVAWHIELLDPFIGDMALEDVHDATLERFIEHRLTPSITRTGKAKRVSRTTVNRSLEVVRRILNLAARKWRHENGMTWLETAPLISIETKRAKREARKPYPLSWDEQDLLFEELPEDPNRHMALFKVNTGTREQEVCALRWQWEVPVPELNTSVFIIPARYVKNKEDRLVVLNQVARGVIEARRGINAEFVFSYRRVRKAGKERGPGAPLDCMNNTGWQNARKAAAERYAEKFGRPAPDAFARVRVHDLKHTFGRRLRAAGVPEETRKVLLGHTNGDITTHYSAAELAELIKAVNAIDRTLATPAITLLRSAA